MAFQPLHPLQKHYEVFQTQVAGLLSSPFAKCLLYDATEASLEALRRELLYSPFWASKTVFLEMVAELFTVAVTQNVFYVEPNLFNFTAMVVYARERLLQLGVQKNERLRALHEKAPKLEALLRSEIRALASDVAEMVARRRPAFFFCGFLQFASHFVKHGLEVGMRPEEYWLKAEELLSTPRFELEHDVATIEKGDWVLKIAVKKNDLEESYIKTLHRKWSARKKQPFY
ncbi:hypothetical protein QR680_017806 [Steinernema hermaphroditum]|uniref:Uncharacterized protein n=1 Tax=Steinernema hermaphroditum TaxID=289476 RepID=A0AA39LPP9_9BILA|nr:hypothetical protein QR680_017806 [Steinernema hermaphroditum]